jgi:hypothetical protein
MAFIRVVVKDGLARYIPLDLVTEIIEKKTDEVLLGDKDEISYDEVILTIRLKEEEITLSECQSFELKKKIDRLTINPEQLDDC